MDSESTFGRWLEVWAKPKEKVVSKKVEVAEPVKEVAHTKPRTPYEVINNPQFSRLELMVRRSLNPKEFAGQANFVSASDNPRFVCAPISEGEKRGNASLWLVSGTWQVVLDEFIEFADKVNGTSELSFLVTHNKDDVITVNGQPEDYSSLMLIPIKIEKNEFSTGFYSYSLSPSGQISIGSDDLGYLNPKRFGKEIVQKISGVTGIPVKPETETMES